MKAANRRRGRAGSGAVVGRSFGLALVMIALTPTLGRSQPDSKITVRVYNYAQVSDRTLAGAEAEARRIFDAAGVDSLWLDCLDLRGQSQSGFRVDCARPLVGATVVLRILPGSSPAAFGDTILGFAKGSMLASVFYGRIAELAHRLGLHDSEIPVILGDASTHELGHLLLGTGAHSLTGIMRTEWDSSHLQSALRGHQFFTDQQSQHIRNEVLARSGFDQNQLTKIQK